MKKLRCDYCGKPKMTFSEYHSQEYSMLKGFRCSCPISPSKGDTVTKGQMRGTVTRAELWKIEIEWENGETQICKGGFKRKPNGEWQFPDVS